MVDVELPRNRAIDADKSLAQTYANAGRGLVIQHFVTAQGRCRVWGGRSNKLLQGVIITREDDNNTRYTSTLNTSVNLGGGTLQTFAYKWLEYPGGSIRRWERPQVSPRADEGSSLRAMIR